LEPDATSTSRDRTHLCNVASSVGVCDASRALASRHHVSMRDIETRDIERAQGSAKFSRELEVRRGAERSPMRPRVRLRATPHPL
jgi:hypothetical protein